MANLLVMATGGPDAPVTRVLRALVLAVPLVVLVPAALSVDLEPLRAKARETFGPLRDAPEAIDDLQRIKPCLDAVFSERVADAERACEPVAERD